MADERDVCQNAGCSCVVTDEDGDYCSGHCASAGGTTEIACGCGHPECAGAV